MNTRHIYTTQKGIVIVLEHISTIHITSEHDGNFRVYDLTGKFLTVPDVELEKTHSALQKYKTTERAELIKALAAI